VEALSSQVLRTIRAHALIGPQERVAIAVSGGADSVALVWLLQELIAHGLDATIAGLLHVNHTLRGAESDRDEAFCRQLAARLQLPIETTSVDVAALARAERRSMEAVARDVRYRFFEDAAPRLRATVVATGHTQDDQAETVLLRLLRGAGGRGLSGIRIRRGSIIRPLLECRRADLRRYLQDRGKQFCEDSSNADIAITRNHVRHRLLPVIEEIAPGGTSAIARAASLSQADEACLSALARNAAPNVLLSSGDAGVQMNAAALASEPIAVARRLIRQAIEQVHAGRSATAGHIDAVLSLASAASSVGRSLDLPGVRADRCGDVLLIRRAIPNEVAKQGVTRFEVTLPLPGSAEVPEAGFAISAMGGLGQEIERRSGPDVAVVAAAALSLPLAVRNRRPGDRLRPSGAPGHRKLQDILVDRKIPRAERDRVPLVVDAAGRIVWVAGVTIAEECRVTAPSAGVVVLKVHKRILS
jgi:tRNA(Ile)-lysidine synthase